MTTAQVVVAADSRRSGAPGAADPSTAPGRGTTASPAPQAARPGPAFVPYQLSDEMCTLLTQLPPHPPMINRNTRCASNVCADANVYRQPDHFGYPVIDAGVVRAPKYGYLFLERRSAGQRRPKLVDGLDWVPSSAANASTRLLQDGVTELVRYYCARRTKADVARPQVKPYVVFQRSVYEKIKAANPRATTYDIKVLPPTVRQIEPSQCTSPPWRSHYHRV